MSDLPPPRETGRLPASSAQRILSEIRRADGIARVDIAQALDLSPATVTAVTQSLLEHGLVIERRGAPPTGRGRPRIELGLNAQACRVAGAKLNAGSLTVAILDFCGTVLADETEIFDSASVDAQTMMAGMDRALQRVLDRCAMVPGDLAAIGLGIPGYVETGTGLCHWSPVLTETPVDVRAMLAQRHACPVFVDNDANLVTLAELWFGHGSAERNFLVVTIEHGVGLGIVIDGQLYRGGRGLGAEFGHTKVQFDGALCRCGQRGCLEAYVADFALAREAATALGGCGPEENVEALIARLAERALAGDRGAAAIFKRAGRMLGLGLANLLNLFDPAVVILAGARMQNHRLLSAEVETVVRDNALIADRDATRLMVHRWGDDLWARGAGALALDGWMQTLDHAASPAAAAS